MTLMRFLVCAVAFVVTTGCATVTGPRDPRDPWEGWNRQVFKFNDALDRAVLKPVAKGYTKVVPRPVRQGVSNFFSNLGDIAVVANDVFQLKLAQAVQDSARFLFNTTFGLAGLIDVSTGFGLPKHDEDFGQTLGYWGVGSGPYYVIPFLGPSTVRDVGGRLVDSAFQPTNYIEDRTAAVSLFALDLVNTRANLLSATAVLEEAALDKYVFTRDAFLQRRLKQVHDGSPPKGSLEEEIEFDDEQPEASPAQPAPQAPTQ